MKTADLIDQVAARTGIARSAAKEAVEAMLSGIVAAAKQNLPGFGKFKVKESPARQGRNPATGETIAIAASRKLGFAPAKQVKDALAG